MRSSFRHTLVIGLIAASMAMACGNDDSPTEPSTTAPARGTEIFSGRLERGGSQFYSFSVVSNGTTDITLLSLRTAGVPTSTLNLPVGLGLGTPAATDCAVNTAINTAPGLTKQLTATTNSTVYCVKISDVGNLAGPVDYTVRILHP